VSTAPLEYRVEDRSILLPFYRRAVIAPLLPHIPARISPNAITWAGHFVHLAGVALLLALRPRRGAVFFVAAVTLQVYVWCDNADGGHARRTGQCSPRGEFLDHGLDTLSVVYIALLTCLALGVSPGWYVALTLVIPTAASVTYWEQSHTGTFHLGLLNQIESTVLLGAMLCLAGFYGDDFSVRLALGGVTLRGALCAWTVVQIAVGIARGMLRTARVDRTAFVSIAPLGAFDVAVAAAAAGGALPVTWAVAAGIAGNVFFGLRMLVRRLGQERPQAEALTLVGAAALGLAAVAGRGFAVPIAAALCAVYAVAAGLDFREGLRRSDAGGIPRAR
jgi:phosphatidylglycerophosphate synthase